MRCLSFSAAFVLLIHLLSKYIFSKVSFMSERLEGTVKWFNDEKGYGFITQENGKGDIFVHFRQVNNPHGGRVSLREGQRVSYVVGQGLKGPQAEDVTIL